MSIKKEMDQYYEYGRLLWNNRSLIKKEENETQWAIDEGDYDKTCEHMNKFIKLIEQDKKFRTDKTEQEEKLIRIIKNYIGDEMTDGEIAECIQRDNKLVICLLRQLEKNGLEPYERDEI